MEQINIENILRDKTPALFEKYPKFVQKLTVNFLEKFLAVKKINKFMEENKLNQGISFIDSLFNELNVTFDITANDLAKIPSEGSLVVVSNHPLGGLDGLGLIKAFYDVRKDVRIVANDILMQVQNLQEFFIPVDLYSPNRNREVLVNMGKSLMNEEAIIFFPAAKVSRLGLNGIKDGKWLNGALKFATKYNAPVLPVYVKARNSMAFYLLALMNDKIGTFMLPQELFRAKNARFQIVVGDLIPPTNFKNTPLNLTSQTNLLKKHCYRVGKRRKGIYKTETTIIHPVDPRLIKHDLENNKLLGATNDKKQIYLVEYQTGKNILKEISRLRELTFRKVGEGTGRSSDSDIYDIYYKHIVLWDPEGMEIVGSYRVGESADIVRKYGKLGFYNSSQFNLEDKFDEYIDNSLEMGRSFIQPRYWRSNALDFIWQGIGSYLSLNPHIRYLWGAVSISNTYSELAKGLIVSYYKNWYSGPQDLVVPFNHFQIHKNIQDEINQILNADNYTDDFKNLKNSLKNLGFSIPVLYRRYTEMSNYGGVKFLGFTIDVNFNNAIDGLILIDLTQLKDEYKERFIGSKSFINNNE